MITAPETATTHDTACIVVLHGYPVFFHTNACGRMFEMVERKRATVFPNHLAALTELRNHSTMRSAEKSGRCEIVPANEKGQP